MNSSEEREGGREGEKEGAGGSNQDPANHGGHGIGWPTLNSSEQQGREERGG